MSEYKVRKALVEQYSATKVSWTKLAASMIQPEGLNAGTALVREKAIIVLI
jgi:hypothetical protein